jgi:hypothetical protein
MHKRIGDFRIRQSHGAIAAHSSDGSHAPRGIVMGIVATFQARCASHCDLHRSKIAEYSTTRSMEFYAMITERAFLSSMKYTEIN